MEVKFNKSNKCSNNKTKKYYIDTACILQCVYQCIWGKLTREPEAENSKVLLGCN